MRYDLTFWEQFAPVLTDRWREFAACIDTPEYVFFYEPDDPDYEVYQQRAQNICDSCPVWADCLDDAIYHDDCGHRAMNQKARESIIMFRKRNSKAFEYDLGILNE